MDPALKEKLEKFLHSKDVLKELRKLAATGQKSLVVEFERLLGFDVELAKALLDDPTSFLEAADAMLTETTKLPTMRLRVKGLPSDRTISIRKIRAEQVGKFIQVEGILTRAGEIRPEIKVAVFECLRCGEEIRRPQIGDFYQEPWACPNPNCGKRGRFRLVVEDSEFCDWQSLRVQERPEELRGGRMPHQLDGIVRDDFVDKAVAGNHVVITGVLHAFQEALGKRQKRTFRKVLFVNHIDVLHKGAEEAELTPEDEARIEELAKDPRISNLIIQSISPSIHGHEYVKEAIALQLFGCDTVELPDGTRIRGDSHILLTGDPACLVGDERIVLGNGAIVRIGELGSEHLQPLKLQVLTGQGYRKALATRFHIYRNQPILEIVTETGKSIKGTPNHPLLVVEKQRSRQFPCPPVRIWKRLDEIRPGDRVATVPWIPCTITAPVETGWRPLTRRYCPRPKCKLPNKLDEEVAAFLGYLLGDGWVRRTRVGFNINNEEKDLLPILSSIVKRKFWLDLKVRRVKQERGNIKQREIRGRGHLFEAEIHSVDVAANLRFLQEKRVPALVLKSGNKVVAEFLAWLFEADGCVFSKSRGRRGIQLKAKNIELLRDIQMLLLRFGIHSRIVENNLVIHRARSILRYSESIGFRSKKKRTELDKLVADCRKLNPLKCRGKQLSERVVCVRPAGYADVYDIEVPEVHRFIANGVISHNTAKSQLLKWVAQVAPRGLYTSGMKVTGAGLCVTPDSLIMFSDGSVTEIGEYVERNLGGTISSATDIVVDKVREPKACISLSQELGSTHRFVEKVWRLPAPKTLIRIETKTGKKIQVTPENPLLVIRDGEPRWVRARDIRKNDFIATFRVVNVKSGEPAPLISWITGRVVVVGAKEFINEIIEELKKKYGSLRKAAKELDISEDALYYRWRRNDGKGNPFLSSLTKLAKCVGLAHRDLAKHCTVLRQPNGTLVRIPPYPNPDFMYFVGLIAAHGHVGITPRKGREIRFFAANGEELAKYVALVKSLFGITPKLRRDGKRVTEARFHSKLVADLLSKFGVPHGKKSRFLDIPNHVSGLPDQLLAAYVRGLFDCDGSVVVRRGKGSHHVEYSTTSEKLARKLQVLLLRFGVVAKLRAINRKKTTVVFNGRRIVSRKKKWEILIRGLDNLLKFREKIGFTKAGKKARLDRIIAISHPNPNLDLVPYAGLLVRRARKSLGIPPTRLYGKTSHKVEWGGMHPSREFLANIVSRLESSSTNGAGIEELTTLRNLAFSDICWDEVTKIKNLRNHGIEYVYDLTVSGAHNFFVNGIVVHNTAAAVRDELTGGWTLEAGALVIADGGLAAIDEFEKMSDEDASAMLEAMEQQTISVAKAGIVATLNARTAILAAANPKLGRFDPYRPLPEQIALSPVILSRFDLVFIMRDEPHEERDKDMARHILQLHQKPEAVVKAPLDVETLRKIIIYARKKIHPKFEGEEPLKVIQDFYVNWRAGAQREAEPLPITPRQLEALVRLAKAYARMRLSDKVTVEDAKRAIRLVKTSLEMASYDYVKGVRKIDIDALMTGRPRSQRERIQRLMDIVKELEEKFDGVAPLKEIERMAGEEGMSPDFVEFVINQEVERGHLYKPTPDAVKRVVRA